MTGVKGWFYHALSDKDNQTIGGNAVTDNMFKTADTGF